MLKQQLELLSGAGIDAFAHSDRGLLDHLSGTRALLLDWGLHQTLCDAGLFHSVYGTEIYAKVLVSPALRACVRDVIGVESERLVWLFSVMARLTLAQNLGRERDLFVIDRTTQLSIAITTREFEDLVHLLLANDLEQIPRVSRPIALMKLDMLLPFASILRPTARLHLEQEAERLQAEGRR
jgi:hypothetical protein